MAGPCAFVVKRLVCFKFARAANVDAVTSFIATVNCNNSAGIHFHAPRNAMLWSAERPFQALTLTGGGFRGLFTARVLQRIEEHIDRPIGGLFDLTCGTSIGGIIALAIAYEIPISKVVKMFEEMGEVIFPWKGRTGGLRKYWDLCKYAKRPKYSNDALRNVVSHIFPNDITLGDALHPIAIPAVNVTEGKPQVFKTRHRGEWYRDSKFKAVDVALATSAAPTFFALAELGGNLYADGGLFANSPDAIALHEAQHYFQVPLDLIRMLSIGTTTKNYSLSFRKRSFGVVDWLEDERIFSVIISAQQQFVDQLMKHRLGPQYLRIDREPSEQQAGDLGLDVASDIAIQTLKALAEKAVTDVMGTSLKSYLTHVPQLAVLKE